MGIRDWEQESLGDPRDIRVQKIRDYVRHHMGACPDIEDEWRANDEKYKEHLFIRPKQ